MTLSGGLRIGTVIAKNVDMGDGTVASVVRAINTANAGVVATVIQTGPAAYRVQLASTTTGAASKLTIYPQAVWSETTVAQDAQLTVGSGPSARRASSTTACDLAEGSSMTKPSREFPEFHVP